MNEQLKTFPDIFQQKLLRQEYLIKKFNQTENRNKELNEFISVKSHKKPEDTLMAKSENFRTKQQINNLISYKEPQSEKFGQHNSW